jgi:hypothetical protein
MAVAKFLGLQYNPTFLFAENYFHGRLLHFLVRPSYRDSPSLGTAIGERGVRLQRTPNLKPAPFWPPAFFVDRAGGERGSGVPLTAATAAGDRRT